MKALLAIVLLLDLLAPAAATLRAQTPSVVEDTGVTGYVLAPDGTPVSEGIVVAQVYLSRTPASIDRTGRFRLVTSRSGLHQVVVSVPGLAPYRIAVTVPPSTLVRLPVIRLAPAVYFRVRFVSATGEPITAPPLRRRLFDIAGNPMPDALSERVAERVDADGATVIGPMPRSVMTLSVDSPFFAQTRLPDVNVGGDVKVVDGGTVVLRQPGAVLHVNVVDGNGAPVLDHNVFLEDALPRSPLIFRPVRTDRQGRATFDRLAAGPYRVWTSAVDRCANQTLLTTERDLPLSGAGTVETQLIAGGDARFHISTPIGPARGMRISAAPNISPSQLPPGITGGRSTPSGCSGTTDADGRVTLTNFPPGPAHVDVHMANSTYVRQVAVPLRGPEMTIAIPDGYLPVRVLNAVTNQPVARASITWSGGGARVEAVASVTGEALLEGVGTAGGTLAVSADRYEPAQEQLAEPPGIPHDFVLMPVAPRRILRPRVVTSSGDALPNAVVELLSADSGVVPEVAVTDAKGAVTFSDVPPGSLQLSASADGFVIPRIRIGDDTTGEIVLTLSQGYRVIASVELPATAGPQAVRVVNDANVSMENVLDSASDRGFEPPAGLSLGPLAPGEYVIELYGAAGRRQERVRIVDRDVHATFR